MKQKEELIRKLFHDQCSREELEALLELIRNDPSEAGPEVMKELMQQLEEIPDYEQAIFDRIKFNIDTESLEAQPIEGQPFKPQRSIPSRRSWLLRVAASVCILAIGSWAIYHLWGDTQIHQQTAFGEIKSIELPDGSRVSLNGNSSITYAQHWEEGETRQVYLKGEAFFEVEKKPATHAKFQVITQGLTVEVLGTSFNVNHRNQTTAVFLEEGSVKIKADDAEEREVLLKPGEIIHYTIAEKSLSTPKLISGSVQSSWKTGMLEFENASLLDILGTLAEANDIQFEVREENLTQQRLTISIPTHDMGLAMSVLSRTSGTEIRKVDETFIIQSRTD